MRLATKCPVADETALKVEYLTCEQYRHACRMPNKHILGAICHGHTPKEPTSWPAVRTDLTPLDSKCVEIFRTDDDPKYMENDLFTYAMSREFTFGSLTDQAARNARIEDSGDIYMALLQYVSALETPHLARMWNIIPKINNVETRIETYKLFCARRSRAFEHYGIQGRTLPAASAVGSHGERLNICFLANNQLGEPIENPNQISAYKYPPKYGMRAPSFVRSRLYNNTNINRLLVSGTASILGHETKHIGNVSAQTRLALSNIYTIVNETERLHGAVSIEHGTQWKVYIRSRSDLKVVQKVINETMSPTDSIIYLEADICRSNLLVEIEAIMEMRHVNA